MTKIIALSDTHTLHSHINIPEADIIIHAGDYSGRGTEVEFHSFINWFSSLDQCKHKVLISGNHDRAIEKHPELRYVIPKNIHYLHNTSCEVLGIKIWGSPFTRYFFDWSFNGLDHPPGELNKYYGGPGSSAHPDKDHPLLDDVYSEIPLDTDIVVCHNPAYGILDANEDGVLCGSHSFLKHIRRVKPKLVIHGHIHAARGNKVVDGVHYYNVCSIERDSMDSKSYPTIVTKIQYN